MHSTRRRVTNLSLGSQIWAHRLNTVSALDNVRLEGYRSRSSVQLQKKSTCIAKDGAKLVTSP